MNWLQIKAAPDDFTLLAIGAVVAFVLTMAVHVAFAVGVAAHAKRRRTVLVGRFWWVVATLLGGVLVAVAYWAMHASTLVREDDGPAPSRPLRRR